MISVGSNKAHWKLSVTKSAKSSSSKSSSVGRILMRNEVGQEATEEMSAFKSVVNLFIIVLHYMSLHNNMLSRRSDEEGEVSQSREVLCGKAYTVVMRAIGSLATRGILKTMKLYFWKKNSTAVRNTFVGGSSLSARCALTYRLTWRSGFGCAPAACRGVCVCHSLSMCFLWMIKGGKMRSSSSTLVWRRSGRSEILAVTQRGREKETSISFRRTRLRAERG